MAIQLRKKIAVAAYVVAIVAVFSGIVGCSDTESNGREPEITGVFARDTEVEYDGRRHGIEIMNTVETDEVYYATETGEWQSERIEYTDAGEYIIRYTVKRKGYKDYKSEGKVKIRKTVADWISAADKRVVYDGEKHGIEIAGADASDRIEYSDDGEKFTHEIGKREVGRYRIFYRVESRNYEYNDSCELIILPEIRGKYYNTEKGVKEISDISYDETGSGEINGERYTVNNGVMECDGTEYEKINADEDVYEISINGERKIYARGKKDRAVLRVKIDEQERTAVIEVDGTVITTITGFNYSASGTELTLTEKHAEIRLENLKEAEVSDIYELIIYDGNKHKHTIENGWTADKEPEYSEPGRYDDILELRRDGYLPKRIRAVMEIAEDLSGVYYNEQGIIEIEKGKAKKDGKDLTMEYKDGGWRISGEAVEQNGVEGIIYAGDRYAKATRNAVEIKIGGRESAVRGDVTDVEIKHDGKSLTVKADGETVYTAEMSWEITVTVNGEEMRGINDGGSVMYIIGAGELTGAVRIELEARSVTA